MKVTTVAAIAVVVAVGAIGLVNSATSGHEAECHPWTEEYVGTFQQFEGPGANSTVQFHGSKQVDAIAQTPDSPFHASGQGSFTLDEDNHASWTLSGSTSLDTGAQIAWNPTYKVTAVECDQDGNVVRIQGDGINTAPYPSEFDFSRTG